MTDPMTELAAALAEAEHYNSSWCKISPAALHAAIEQLQRLRAVRAVPVIDGEFVDADELYRALGEPKPAPTREIPNELADRWREHALDFAAEVQDLRRRIDHYVGAEQAMTEINNLQVAEIRQLRFEAGQLRRRYVVGNPLGGVLVLWCLDCLEADERARAVVALVEEKVTGDWPVYLHNLNAAARAHDDEFHRAARKRRHRPHNRAGRRAKQERDSS